MTVRKKVKLKQTQGPRIYIGPSFLGLKENTVFKYGGESLPPNVRDLISKYPEIVELMVPIEGLQEARKNVLKTGHILNRFRNQILKGKVNGI